MRGKWRGYGDMICAPSPSGVAGTGTTDVVVLALVVLGAVAVVGAGVVFEDEDEDEGNCGSFQKLEELAGSAWTTSLLLSDEVAREAFEGERVSQVVRLFGAGFSLSVFSEWVAGLLSPTVALRMGLGFFSVDLISTGSSESSSFSPFSPFSRPIIHHEPEDFVWTLTASVFLSSMSPIRRSQSKEGLRGVWGNPQPMFLIATLNLFQSHR
jgi:hypothetical protein